MPLAGSRVCLSPVLPPLTQGSRLGVCAEDFSPVCPQRRQEHAAREVPAVTDPGDAWLQATRTVHPSALSTKGTSNFNELNPVSKGRSSF